MITVNRINENITGSCDGVRYSCLYSESKFTALSELAAKAAAAESVDEYNAIVVEFKEACKQSYSEFVETKCTLIVHNAATGKYYLKLPNGTRSTREIPVGLVDRILKSFELNIDVMPLIKFWMRAIRPVKGKKLTNDKLERLVNYVNYQSVDKAYANDLMREEGVSMAVARERATFFQVPITQEGLLCTYKVSTEVHDKYDPITGEKKSRYEVTYDEETGEKQVATPAFAEDKLFQPAIQGTSGDAFWCESSTGAKKLGHLIKVGHRHYLDSPDKIDQRDSVSCVKGLHVGNTDYIEGYHTPGRELHEVFVDPADVWAITDDGSGALRVMSYFIYKVHNTPNRGIYHSSKYAALKDEEWEAMRLEIQKEQDEAAAKLAEAANTAKSELEGLDSSLLA